MKTRRARWIALAAVACAVAASPAGAAPPQDAAVRYGAAPGGDSFAVVAGRPHVAYVRPGGIRVAKLLSSGQTWRNVGGLVRHARHSMVEYPCLIGGPDGHPWLTWVEGRPRSREPQVRVATFAHGRWREVGRGAHPINGRSRIPPHEPRYPISRPSIAFYRGRPVVAFVFYVGSGFASTQAAQLRPGGRTWRRLPPIDSFWDARDVRLVVAGRRLYAAGTSGVQNPWGFALAARLNTAGSAWKPAGQIDPSREWPGADHQSVDGAANVNGLFTVLWRHEGSPRPHTMDVSSLGEADVWTKLAPPLVPPDSPVGGLSLAGDGPVVYAAYRDFATPGLQLRRLTRGVWEALPTPTDPGYRGISAQLAPGRGGGMWLLSGERAGGRTRYVLDGYGVEPSRDSGFAGTPAQGSSL